mmetsp:Transcript_3229/g.4936  ORF Transcript_3229/g.4936 Transcript_3229/m.4936 type:complete len:385 (+) Transcript_3229:83-1237(+)
MAKSPGRRAWGAIAPKQNVSLLNIMSEQLATEIQKGGDGNPKNTSPATASPHIMQELKAMGFSSTRINTAALATGNRRTESALEWLLANPADEAVQDDDEEDHADTQNNNSERLSIEEQDAQDHAIALQLAATENTELSLEEARQLHRPFSKISVSKDANLARYHREQRRAMRERLAEYEAEWEDSGSSYRRPTHTSSSNDKSAVGGGTLLEQQVREMVTKHDAEASGESNAEKLMNLEFENDYNSAGDMSDLRLSNRTFNSFRRQIQRMKTRSDRKNTGGRRTRATFAKTVSGDAAVAIAEREHEVGPNLGPGAPCMAFASADRQWRAGVVTGLATSLPRRYKVSHTHTHTHTHTFRVCVVYLRVCLYPQFGTILNIEKHSRI